ncbi:hypothetical protein ES703_67869 [subsurface metagenome]
MPSKGIWYEVVKGDKEIFQGDFILKCPTIIPPIDNPDNLIKEDEISVTVRYYNVVILSQSCDIVQGKLDLILVCPYWKMKEFENFDSFYKKKEAKEALRRGYLHSFFLLDKCNINGFEHDYLVVNFRTVFSVSLETIKELAKGKRLRLISPYREHLSQAYAKFMMRVGLPSDIPKFVNHFF